MTVVQHNSLLAVADVVNRAGDSKHAAEFGSSVFGGAQCFTLFRALLHIVHTTAAGCTQQQRLAFAVVATHDVNIACVQQLQREVQAYGRSHHAHGVQHNGDAFCFGSLRRTLHSNLLIEAQRTEIQHQCVGTGGNFDNLLRLIGHNRRSTCCQSSVRTAFRCNIISNFVDDRSCLTQLVNQLAKSIF